MKLTLTAIEKNFNGRPVLSGASCDFAAGQISTVLGVSGCGKTTLLRIAAGLEAADRGEVWLGDSDATRWPPQRRNVGFVFQDLGVYGHLSVERNLSLPLLARGMRRSAARIVAGESAQHFGLASFLDRPAASLSGGEAQRLALAKALVRQPDVMLLDEPFSHLDAPLRRQARDFLFAELRRRGTTTVLVTHDHQDAQEAGGTVFFLDQGRIQQSGTWYELYRRPVSERIARVVSFRDPLALHGRVQVGSSGMLTLVCQDPPVTVPISPEITRSALAADDAADLFFRTEALTAVPLDGGDLRDGEVRAEAVGSLTFGHDRYVKLRLSTGAVFEARLAAGAEPAGRFTVALSATAQLLAARSSG